MWSPSTPVTGAPQTGFTSHTYTLVADNAPSLFGKQYYVSAVGGTQTGVTVHSVGNPNTIAFFRPGVLKTLPPANPVTGVISSFPRNVYKQVSVKGVPVAANQPLQKVLVRIEISVPAGAETYAPAEVRAAISLAIGAAWAQSAGIGDTAVVGTI